MKTTDDAAFARLDERNRSFQRARKAFHLIRFSGTIPPLDDIESMVIRALNGEFDEQEQAKPK